ncbi:MAG: helicase [Proteobacteria bacterium]|nr:helicase [Pseudomonadota bacterium]
MDYEKFLDDKAQLCGDFGFDPIWMPDFLFDFQKSLVEWALRKGRAAIFADCGLGKTPMQLVWAQNVLQKMDKPVLILTPLAVSLQTVREGAKFGIEVKRSNDGTSYNCITVTNYEQLHKFNPNDFSGVVCDESSILKSFDGERKQQITEFMRKVKYRLLTTATAAPNDYIELGTSSEALGYLGFTDMLGKFFKNDNNNIGMKQHYGEAPKWRFKGHAELPFWRWVTSWARACRKPSDLGFEDAKFILPPLKEHKHMASTVEPPEGMLFNLPARSLPEQREERKRTIDERCDMVKDVVMTKPDFSIIWCHMNAEGNRLESIIPNSRQISGADSDDKKEEIFLGFINGDFKRLITKPKIGAWGLNFQHCNHMTYFPSHSFEQFYQSVRRCWRFGQTRPVTVDTILTEGEMRVMENLERKARAASNMFGNLINEMNNSVAIQKVNNLTKKEEVIPWL